MPNMSTKSRKLKEPVMEPVEEEIPFEDSNPAIEEEETITFKRSHFYAGVSVLTFFAGIFIGYLVWGVGILPGLGETTAAVAQAQGQGEAATLSAPTEEPQYIRYDVPTDGFYARGPADAPITIVEFSDYQCPFCRRWHDEVAQALYAAYPNQIRLVYRNLPLTSIHPDALSAAEAALCAGDQNVYWEYHDKLFSGDTLGKSTYMQYAQDLNLNMTTFEACIDNRTHQATVEADSDFAVNLGVRSTPTFFINGLAIVGAQPLDVFKQVIDKELAGDIP
jgi:protein-disulfide isomerase